MRPTGGSTGPQAQRDAVSRTSVELVEAAHALLTGEDSIGPQDELAGIGLALLALWCEQWLKRE